MRDTPEIVNGPQNILDPLTLILITSHKQDLSVCDGWKVFSACAKVREVVYGEQSLSLSMWQTVMDCAVSVWILHKTVIE